MSVFFIYEVHLICRHRPLKMIIVTVRVVRGFVAEARARVRAGKCIVLYRKVWDRELLGG